jgi:hypothetical protein
MARPNFPLSAGNDSPADPLGTGRPGCYLHPHQTPTARTKMNRPLVCSLGLLLAGLVAACGGNDSEPSQECGDECADVGPDAAANDDVLDMGDADLESEVSDTTDDVATPEDSATDGDGASDGEGDAEVVVCGEMDNYINIGGDEDIDAIAHCTDLLGTLRFGDTIFEDIDGLERLRTIDEYLILFRNRQLVSIDGLVGLERVGGVVSIRYNAALPTLVGLGALASVGGLEVQGNDVLTSLDGLSSLEVVHGDLDISRNPQLSQSEAEAFAARLDVAGEVIVQGNGPQ